MKIKARITNNKRTIRHPPRPRMPNHTIPSGLGGVFDVVVVDDSGGDEVRVRVCATGTDFDGKEADVPRSSLTPAYR